MDCTVDTTTRMVMGDAPPFIVIAIVFASVYGQIQVLQFIDRMHIGARRPSTMRMVLGTNVILLFIAAGSSAMIIFGCHNAPSWLHLYTTIALCVLSLISFCLLVELWGLAIRAQGLRSTREWREEERLQQLLSLLSNIVSREANSPDAG